MAADPTDKPTCGTQNQYCIYGQAGYFTFNFTSPYNSLHQISGFKSERDAQAWIDEARLLLKTYR